MAPSRSSERSVVLWVEFGGYYVDELSPVPQVCLRQHRVFDLNSAAWLKGVTLGMQRHQVKVLAPECVYVDYLPDQTRAEKWWDVCAEFSDTVEPLQEHAVAVDLSRHPDAYSTASQLIGLLETLGLGRLKSGIGRSKWLARLSADLGRALEPMHPSFLAALSVTHLLPVSEDIRQRLMFLGYKTTGEVADIPTQVLLIQFGKEGYRVQAAAQGTLQDAVAQLYPPGQIVQHLSFSEGLENFEQLNNGVFKLVNRVATQLEGKQSCELILEWEQDGRTTVRKRTFKRPIQDKATLLASVKSLMQGEDTVGITKLLIRLKGVEAAKGHQVNLFTKIAVQDPTVNVERIVQSFGAQSIHKASDIKSSRREQFLQEWRRATGWN